MKELEKYIVDKKTGLKYELVGDNYYSCPEAPKVGKFGMQNTPTFRQTVIHNITVTAPAFEREPLCYRERVSCFSHSFETQMNPRRNRSGVGSGFTPSVRVS